jgi:hypothetical protein
MRLVTERRKVRRADNARSEGEARRSTVSRFDMISRTRSSTRCCAKRETVPARAERACVLLSWPEAIADSFLPFPDSTAGRKSEVPDDWPHSRSRHR